MSNKEEDKKPEGDEEEFIPKGLSIEEIKKFKEQSDLFKRQFENQKGCCGD